jgi:uncharacterized protein (DUF1501 family)
VCLFLRGAVDGLSLVVPYGEADYYRERPGIAILPPGKLGGAIDLDGRFGFHPRLAPLKPLYDSGALAVLHAVGSPHPSRSHFEAQDYMETAQVGLSSTSGWLARCVAERAALGLGELKAVALTDTPPLALRGAPTLVAARLAQLRLNARPRVRQQLEMGFERMYERSSSEVGIIGSRALSTARRIRELSLGDERARSGVEYPKPTAALRELAALIRAGLGFGLGWVDVQGWDTHQNQGNAETGRLPVLLDVWSRGLAAFWNDLGEWRERVLVLVMTEFGRTVKENGSRGTDHGHGSVMFLLGAGVRGRKVYGRWPGLEPSQRWEGRDLAVTTDFRDVFAEVATQHLGVANLAGVLPGYLPQQALGLFA